MCCVGWHGLVPTELADREDLFFVSFLLPHLPFGLAPADHGRERRLGFFSQHSPLVVVVCAVRAAATQPTEQTTPFFIFFLPVTQAATPDGQFSN